MQLSDFDYDLPRDLIAQSPARPRDSARLLVLRRDTGALEHRIFRDVPEYLHPDDVLVLNDTRVLPARLRTRRATGGEVEVLLLRPAAVAPGSGRPGTRRDLGTGHGAGGSPETWEALVRPGRRLRSGVRLTFGGGAIEVTLGGPAGTGTRLATLRYHGDLRAALERAGEMPVPPYIERPLDDPSDYQTVYAAREGAVAAPTAGLHFTPALLAAIRGRGVRVVSLTLHVGLGTLRGVEVEDVTRHRMDAEVYEIGEEAARVINGVRERGHAAAPASGSPSAGHGRVVVVGTTGVRALESVAREDGTVRSGEGSTDLFITPGFRFRATDALVTNFHLPRTTLLMLVSAFAGRERILAAYAEAIRLRYRFYSFGDAMLIV